ncbi:MAG: AAA family ATPase [Kineosporiaceae bacterium]
MDKSFRLPVRRVVIEPDEALDAAAWPATVPAVRRLLAAGELDLGPATVLVGENGSGKSTVVEALAMAFGMNPEGGSTLARNISRTSESPLHRSLRVERGIGASRWGFFLRAETMHGFYTYLEDNPGTGPEPAFHEFSHGESFLALISDRFRTPGFYVLDEPESALSFTNCLVLLALLHELVSTGSSQVLLATHSPVLAALPGARCLELDDEGWHERAWHELTLVDHHRRFLDDPAHYLRDLR